VLVAVAMALAVGMAIPSMILLHHLPVS